MTGVMSGQSAVPMLLLNVHGLVCPISGSGCRSEGPRGFSPCQRAPRVPRARQKYAKGVSRSRAYVAMVGHFDDVMRLGRGGNYRPRHLSWLRPFRKARAGWRLAFGLE
jgi:hypothetical protein